MPSRISRIQESFFEPVLVGPLLLPHSSQHASPSLAWMQVNRVVVNVPATTANLGPGFDSFGFALDVWNRVTVERADAYSMTIMGEGAPRARLHPSTAARSTAPALPLARGRRAFFTAAGEDRIDTREKTIVVRMCKRALETLGQEMPPLRFECQNAVPPTRGMGSSSAALVSGLAAGLALGGKDLSTPATKKLLLQASGWSPQHAPSPPPRWVTSARPPLTCPRDLRATSPRQKI